MSEQEKPSRVPCCLLPPRQRGIRIVYFLLLATIVGLALFLFLSQKPWDTKLLSSIEKREAAGKAWKIEHYRAVYEWGAACVNLVLAIGLFLTLRAWARPLSGAGGSAAGVGATALPPTAGRWLVIGLIGAVVVGGFFRAQRLDHSLWSDEEYTVRTHIWGQMVEADDGKLEYRPVAWEDTFFRNKLNNHLGFTIPTRLLHSAWARSWATQERPFSEPVLRVLPLLASLGSIYLIGLLVARYAGPVAGLGAAFFLAINPWHLRYSVEARGYSGAIFFLLLAFLFLIPALQRGRWRDWIGFAGCELLAMLCVPGTAYALILANAAAIALIFFPPAGRPLAGRVQVAGRMLVSNVLAAMIFIQLLAPSIPQIAAYLRTDHFAGGMALAWWQEVWTLFTSGLPASDASPGQHLGSSFSGEAAQFPGLRAFHVGGLFALFCIGLVAGVMRRSWLLLPSVATSGGGAIVFIQSGITGNSIHPWYIVFILIGFVILIIVGVQTIADGLVAAVSGRAQVALPAMLLALFLSLYFVSTIPGRRLICEIPRQPIREAVAAVRGDRAYDAGDAGLITASFGTSKGMITSYDPRNHILKSPADLQALIAGSKSQGKRLFVYHCGLQRARGQEPEMVSIVEDPALFEEQLPAVLGLEELFSYHIYRYVGP